MSDTELKACPFCGYNERYVAHIPRKTGIMTDEKYKTVYRVICAKCGAKTGSRRTEKEAEEAWNRRVQNER